MLISKSRFQKMPRGRPAKAKAEEKPAERKEASAEVDENVKLAPKRGRGRPPKDKTGSKSDEKPAEENALEPAVKKAKKPHTSQNVKKISIEFCKS